MSEGPISQWRDSYVPPKKSTTDKARVCANGPDGSARAYCGRDNNRREVWGAVTCEDCKAARRADDEARRRR